MLARRRRWLRAIYERERHCSPPWYPGVSREWLDCVKCKENGLLPLTLLQQQVATNQLVPPTAFGMPPVAMAGQPPPPMPAAMAGKPPPIVK
jgi:hypothetical protein